MPRKSPYPMKGNEQTAFEHYMNAVDAYNSFIEELNKPTDANKDSFGLQKPMTSEQAEQLKKLNEKVLQEGHKMEAFLPEQKKRSSEQNSFALTLRRQTRTALRELSLLENTDPKALPSYQSMHRQFTEITIDTSDNKLGRVGNFMSDRVPLRYLNRKGELEEGFFTMDTAPKWNPDEVIVRTEKNNPALVPLLESLRRKENIAARLIACKNNFVPGDEEDPEAQERFRKSFESLGIDAENYPPGGLTLDERKAISGMVSRLSKYKDMEYTNSIAGIDAGSNINQRNTAMSNIATLIGCEKEVCKSIPMTIMVNGEAVHGNFMKKAVGVELNEVKKDAARDGLMFGGKPSEFKYDSLGRSCANLMIADYICGNIDRHSGNIFFNIVPSEDGKKNEIVSVQGIDNDLSMGTIKPGENQAVKCLPALSDVLTIPKKTAEKVMNLDRETLAGALLPSGLKSAEIDACWARVQKLQSRIRKNKINVVETYTKKEFDDQLGRKLIKDKELKYKPDTPFMHCAALTQTIASAGKKFAAYFKSLVNSIGEKIRNRLVNEARERNKNPNKLSAKINQYAMTHAHSEASAEIGNTRKEMVLEARRESGVKNLQNLVRLDSEAALKGQRLQVSEISKGLEAVRDAESPEFTALMQSVQSLNRELNREEPISRDIRANLLHEAYRDVREKLTAYIPTIDGNDPKAARRQTLAESLDDLCAIGENLRERQVNEFNDIMAESFKSIAECAKALQNAREKGEDSMEFSLANADFRAKTTLAANTGNMVIKDNIQEEANLKAFASIALAEHIRSLKTGDPALYGCYEMQLAGDPKAFENLTEQLLQEPHFHELCKNVNPVTAVSSHAEKYLHTESMKFEVFKAVESHLPQPEKKNEKVL